MVDQLCHSGEAPLATLRSTIVILLSKDCKLYPDLHCKKQADVVNSFVAKNQNLGLDFSIDKLTNSIENIVTGDSFQTEVSLVSSSDLKMVTKKNKWLFNWKYEHKQPEREIYKLTIVGNSNIIQGLISLEVKSDHVYMHLVENAPFNKGKRKVYAGVAGNLVAFACRLSFQRGYEGNVSFLSKSQLIEHYEKSLGARHFGGRIMIIETRPALQLIDKYFKSF